MGAPPLPPPLLRPVDPPPHVSPEPPETAASKLLPQQETPTPKTKMKTINWNKIPNNKVVGKHNIWSLVARSHQHSPMADLDWSEMEGLFCQQAPPAPTPSASPRPSRDCMDTTSRRKESSEITLLDGKRSLNVNIFLKQFRSSNEDIIQLIKDGEHDDIGAEKLRGLLKILPELDELEMLRAFDGDKSKLGNAEKFLLQLIEVPNYKLRIESMLLKEEFAANMSYLEPSINAMIVAGEDLMTNKSLQEVLYMVLVTGNFLNSGGYAGNAAGVKLSSLQKLTDIRANKPGMNLIHFVALQAEKKRKDLLKLPDDMGILEEATKTTVEQLQNEINALDTRIKKVHKQIDLPTTEKEIKEQMSDFLKMAEQEVTALQKDMEELEGVRKSLSDFFCEDPGTFKLEECFRVFHGFCVKFKQAIVENERRRLQEEQAAVRRKQREEQLAVRRRTLGHQSSNGSESECNIVDSLLNDIRSGFQQKKSVDKDTKGKKFGNGVMTSEEDISNAIGSPALSRRRLGSFSCDQPPGSVRDDTYSPDVTPTGSLRRRRSRVPSEEDESLMDFLRSSGHDGTRERKSWGSLDRSWARRAHGGGRKRPDLLAADFSGERERPNSPSPLAENKPLLPQTVDEENKPKAWKQKIEAWLQENEKEEKQSDDLRRRARRLQNNRRSLEADSESEGRSGTLDTLPEGKLADGSQYKRVYPDWRPTIEKTDVVGAMEAIAEAQPQSPVKDKSPWRKSNLNVSNSTEDTEHEARRLRRSKSRGQTDSTNLLAINEEEKRKEVIRTLGQTMSVDERLPVYIRCPNDQQKEIRDTPNQSVITKFKAGKVSPLLARRVFPDLTDPAKSPEDTNLPPFAPRRTKKIPDVVVSDKVEIDSDNIETPPATRRGLKEYHVEKPDAPPRCSRLKNDDAKEEEDTLGDGQFDRFSSARRTRRYRKIPEEEPPKKPEVVSSELVPEKKVVKSEKLQAQSYPVGTVEVQDTESRLKKWQDRLKYRGEPQGVQAEAIANIAKSGEELKNLGQSSTLPRSFRNKTSIDHKDVLEAIGKQLKETADEPAQQSTQLNEEVKVSALDNLAGSSTLPRSYRRRTGIDQSEVLKAIRRFGTEKSASPVSEKFPTATQNKTSDVTSQEQLKDANLIKSDFTPEIRVQSTNTPLKSRTEHEMNDEGFEETQSLVSETPSQGTSSGCNYEGDSVDSPKVKVESGKLLRADSSGSGDTSSGINVKKVERTNSLRNRPQERKSVIPRRSTSMRKTDSQSSLSKQQTKQPETGQKRILNLINKQNVKPLENKKSESKRSDSERKQASVDRQKSRSATAISRPVHCGLPSDGSPKKRVERSSSRSSLRSSRSSLNSSTSVSTVRNIKPVPGISTYTRAIKSLTTDLERDKKPLGPVQIRNKAPVPASRSSSSGSSIGTTTVRPRPRVTSGLSTSFKENTVSIPASRSSSSGSSIGPTLKKSGLGFMRPTASSAAKDAIDSSRLRSTLRTIK